MWHWSSRKDSPKDGERGQLLKVKREVKAEAGLEESSDGLFRMKGEKKAALSTKYSSFLFEEKGAGQILLFNNDQLRNKMNPKHAHLHRQTGREEPSWSRTSTFLLVPHCQHSEDEGAEGGGEEAPPVVPHREERWRHLNAEQHPCAANKHTT